MAEIPQLYTCAGGGKRLMAGADRPYTLFAGECHNSASVAPRFADALDRARRSV